MRSVRVAGARLAYVELGDPAAPPVVLLHGYPADHRSWRHQLPALAEHHRVLALDWFGWGESERRTDLRFDYDTEVARLGRALDALGVAACDLFAHDYGGFLALGFAQRHPARVRRLAILNSRAHRTFVPAWYVAFSAVSLLGRTPLGRLLPFAAINRVGMREQVRTGVVDEETLAGYLGWMSTRDGRRWLAHYFGDYRVPARTDLAAGLGTVRCPTAIVWGAADPYLSTSIAEELATGIPAADLTLLDGVGHFAMEEAPDAVLAALRELLAT